MTQGAFLEVPKEHQSSKREGEGASAMGQEILWTLQVREKERERESVCV